MNWVAVGSTFQPGRGLGGGCARTPPRSRAGVLLQQARQAVDVVLGEAIEVVGDDRARELALVGVVDRRQLQQQAFGDVARADAAADRATARA